MSGSFEAQHPRNHNGTFADKTGGGIPKVSAAQTRRNREDGEFLDNLSGLLETGEATLHTGADGKPCLSIAGFDGENVEAWCETEGRRHWLCLQTDGGHTVRIRWDKDAARKTDCCLGFLHTAHRNGWTVKDTPEYCAHNGTYAADTGRGVEVERDRVTGEYLVDGHGFSQDMPLSRAVETERNANLREETTHLLHKTLDKERPASSPAEHTDRFVANLRDYGMEIDDREPGIVTVGHPGWKETYCLSRTDGGFAWTATDWMKSGADTRVVIGSDADAALAASRKWFDGVRGSGNDRNRGYCFGGYAEALEERSKRTETACKRALERLREAGLAK